MSAYRELAALTREPMRQWWRRTGAWLLLGLAVVGAAHEWVALLSEAQRIEGTLTSALALTDDLLTAVFALARHLVWLVAALEVLRVAVPTLPADPDSYPRNRPLLLLLCVQAGVWPILVSAVLKFGYDLGASRLPHGHSITASLFELIPLVLWQCTLMLFILAIAVTTRRRTLSLALIVALAISGLLSSVFLLLSDTSYYLSDHHSHTHPRWDWLWGPVASASVVYALFFGLLSQRTKVWRTAYSLLVGSLIGFPILGEIFELTHGHLSFWITDAVHAVPNLLIPQKHVGRWLAETLATRTSGGQYSALFYLTPFVPTVWAVVWNGGILAGLYWLLGRPWDKSAKAAGVQQPLDLPETA